MRLSAMMTMVALAGGSAWADEIWPTEDQVVTVCMNYGFDAQTIGAAQELASKMFAGVRVKIDWRGWPHSCPDQAQIDGDVIVITLCYHTQRDQFPGAWAYAMPYEGTHIVVFYDRVRQKMPLQPILLAHVLVHEITHILEGVKRHSASGIMKPQWDSKDLVEMGRKPLGFAEEDVSLIYGGLNARRLRAAQARLIAARQ